MRKRYISLIVCGALAASSLAGFAACGDGNKNGKPKPDAGTADDPIVLTVWASNDQQESVKQMCEAFKAANPDKVYDIKFGVVGESDAKSKMEENVQAGADVYGYAGDQTAALYGIGALSEVEPAVAEELRTRTGATYQLTLANGKCYSYPYAGDNGFFMYYDSSVVSAEEAKTLDGVIAACKKAGRKVHFDYTNSWYALGFAYGMGATYSYEWSGSKPTGFTTTLGDKGPDGVHSYLEYNGQMLKELAAEPTIQKGDDSVIGSSLNTRTVGAIITGTWNAGKVKAGFKAGWPSATYKDGYAATTLPKWKSSLDNKYYDWATMAGGKCYGVNSYSKNLAEAHKLAQFLSSDEMQLKRFQDNNIGPASATVAAMDEVQSNLAIATMLKQKEACSVTDGSKPQSYWDEAGSFATDMTGGTVTDLADRAAKMIKAMKDAVA